MNLEKQFFGYGVPDVSYFSLIKLANMRNYADCRFNSIVHSTLNKEFMYFTLINTIEYVKLFLICFITKHVLDKNL